MFVSRGLLWGLLVIRVVGVLTVSGVVVTTYQP